MASSSGELKVDSKQRVPSRLPDVPSRVRVDAPTRNVYGFVTVTWVWVVGACAVLFGIVVLYITQWMRYRSARNHTAQLLYRQAPVLMYNECEGGDGEYEQQYNLLDVPLVDDEDGDADINDTDGTVVRLPSKIPRRVLSRDWYESSRKRQHALQHMAHSKLIHLVGTMAASGSGSIKSPPPPTTTVGAETEWAQWMKQSAQDAGTPPRLSTPSQKSTTSPPSVDSSVRPWHDVRALAHAFEYLPSPSLSSSPLSTSNVTKNDAAVNDALGFNALINHWTQVLDNGKDDNSQIQNNSTPSSNATSLRRQHRRRQAETIEELPDDARVSTVPVRASPPSPNELWQAQMRTAERLLPANTLALLTEKYRPTSSSTQSPTTNKDTSVMDDDIDFMKVF